jgi:erythromycin esterase
LAALLALGCGGGASNTASQPPAPAPDPGPVVLPEVAWAKKAAVPFSSIDCPDQELTFLDGLVGDATVLGMGEAAHGASEFQRMKSRTFKYLVEHKGFTVFCLEAQVGRCMDIDTYVTTGVGDPAQLVYDQGFWVWDTQEMLDLVNWMRSYNLDPAHGAKLRFMGMDMQDGGDELRKVGAYIRSVDPAAYLALDPLIQVYLLRVWDGPLSGATFPASDRILCRENVQTVQQWLVDHEEACTGISGKEAYAVALRLAGVVRQSLEYRATYGSLTAKFDMRDQDMAANVVSYLAQAAPGTRLVISAHNAHVSRQPLVAGQWAMGGFLDQALHQQYVPLGFAFHAGTIVAAANYATKEEMKTPNPIQLWTVPPSAARCIEFTLFQAGLDRAYLPLRNLDPSQAGQAWFLQSQALRDIGATYDGTSEFNVISNVQPDRFDGLIFLRDVEASHVLDTPW